MTDLPEGNAVVYCEGAFGTTNGKTAHGLVRRTTRYRVLSVVDSRLAGRDAGEVLDGATKGIPVVSSIDEAMAAARAAGTPATHLVVGLAPDSGRLSAAARADVRHAVDAGLNVDCGLHDYLSDDPDIAALAAARGVALRDIRRPPPVDELHFFTGKIEEVTCLKVAILGTDSAVGKRTTAWVLLDALEAMGQALSSAQPKASVESVVIGYHGELDLDSLCKEISRTSLRITHFDPSREHLLAARGQPEDADWPVDIHLFRVGEEAWQVHVSGARVGPIRVSFPIRPIGDNTLTLLQRSTARASKSDREE